MDIDLSQGAPQRVDLNLLRTFLAVYRAGSFTAAAGRLGLSQPSVTSQIRSLEQVTDRQLFTRLHRGVEPTTFAHELAARVAGPLDALGAVDDGAGPLGGRAAPVHLAGPSELLCTRVLPALASLVSEGLQLRVSQGMTEPLMDQLRAGDQDLVIATRRPRGRSLESWPLIDEEYVLVTSPAWLSRIDELAQVGDTCAALRDVPLVVYSEDAPIVRRYFRQVFGKPSPAGGSALTVPNLHAVVAAVVAGAGYSVLPRSICEEHLEAGRMVLVDDPTEPPLNTMFLVRRPGADSNPDVVRVERALHAAASGW